MAHVAMVVSGGHRPDPRVHKAATALSKSGFNVTVIAFDRQANLPEEDKMGYAEYQVRRIKPKKGKGIKSGSVSTLLHLKYFRTKASEMICHLKPDVVYLHDADTLALASKVVKSVSRTKGEWVQPKIVFDMHDLAHTWALWKNPKNPIRIIAANYMKKKMIKRAKKANLVITSSSRVRNNGHPGFKQWLAEHEIESICIPNYPLSNESSNGGKDNGKGKAIKLESWPTTPTIGYIGRVRDVASFELLAKALELIPQDRRPHLRIAGDGIAQGGVKEIFSRLVNEGLRVEISNGFSIEELPGLISQISVMYCLYDPRRGNIMEGALPVKMHDAAAHARPVICNSDCLMEDVLELKGYSGIAVKWGDVTELSSTISQLTATVKPVDIQTPDNDYSTVSNILLEAISSILTNQ